jgi:hypothetical protein
MQLGECASFLRLLIWSLMQFLTLDQKQQHVTVCEELCQFTSKDANFFYRVITGGKSWRYSYDPETKQQSSQRKSTNSPRLKKGETGYIKGTVHKEFTLARQTVNSAYYCNVLWQLHQNV